MTTKTYSVRVKTNNQLSKIIKVDAKNSQDARSQAEQLNDVLSVYAVVLDG